MTPFLNNFCTSCCKIYWFWTFTTVSFIPEKGGISRNSSFKPSLMVEITHWFSVINFHWSTKKFQSASLSGNWLRTESWFVEFHPLGTKATYRIWSRSVILVAWWIRTFERFLKAWIVVIPRPEWWPTEKIFSHSGFLSTCRFCWKRSLPLWKWTFAYLRHEFQQLFVLFLPILQLLLKLFSKNTLPC